MTNFCSNCGAQLRENARFCPKCGDTIHSSTGAEQVNRPDPVRHPGTTMTVPKQLLPESHAATSLTRGHWIFFSSLAGAVVVAFFTGLIAYFTALPGASMHDESNPAGIAFSAACGPAYGGAVFGLVIGAGLGWLLSRGGGSRR